MARYLDGAIAHHVDADGVVTTSAFSGEELTERVVDPGGLNLVERQTVEDGRVARHDVQLGIRGDGATELVGGVAEGAEVIIPDGQRLEVGARVRPERD